VTETSRYELELPGCTPEPLMAYLKALGIFRLVGEQKDPAARGWWKHDVFCLRSAMLFEDAGSEEGKRDALMKFFLEEYQPTPIVAPWAGGSGFFKKDDKTAVNSLSEGSSSRTALFAKVIGKVRHIIEDSNISEKPLDDDKARLIARYRRELPDEVVTWMDAAMVLGQEEQWFAPLLGTGGNDGRLDFTQNLMQRIVALGLHQAEAANTNSCAWIRHTLFLTPAKLRGASVGQFVPGRSGGPNATQGMAGYSMDNPWDFVLMMEGAVFFAGALVRRMSGARLSRAAFPFTVRRLGQDLIH
jgi:CRISPR-associated protein Csx17